MHHLQLNPKVSVSIVFVAALFIGAQQERALTVSGPDRRDSRIHQLKLRGIERVLYRELRCEERQQKEQGSDGGRHHGHSGTAERVENVTVERALQPARTGTRPLHARLYTVGHHGIGHWMSRFRPDG